MDAVLEEVCRNLPYGGDHETRKRIAQSLTRAAKKGNVTLAHEAEASEGKDHHCPRRWLGDGRNLR
jgi:hypothetical protein